MFNGALTSCNFCFITHVHITCTRFIEANHMKFLWCDNCFRYSPRVTGFSEEVKGAWPTLSLDKQRRTGNSKETSIWGKTNLTDKKSNVHIGLTMCDAVVKHLKAHICDNKFYINAQSFTVQLQYMTKENSLFWILSTIKKMIEHGSTSIKLLLQLFNINNWQEAGSYTIILPW